MRKIFVTAIVALMVCLPSCSGNTKVLDWPMENFGADGNRVFVQQEDSSQDNNLLAWRFKLDGGSSTPAIFDNKMYVSGDDKFYCLDARTGKLMWEIGYEDGFVGNHFPIPSAPTVVDGRVYLGIKEFIQKNSNSYMALGCLDAYSGKTIWSKRYDKGFATPIVFMNGLIFFADETNRLACMDSEGNEQWEYQADEQKGINGLAANGKDRLVFSAGNQLVCVEAKTGREAWKHKDSYTLGSPVCSGGMVYVKSNLVLLNCIDGATGSIIWTLDEEGDASESLPVVADKTVISLSRKNCLFIDKTNGKVLYKNEYGSDNSTPVVYNNHSLFYVSNNFNDHFTALVRVDLSNGKCVWQYGLQNDTQAKPIIAGDKVCICDDTGNLIAINMKLASDLLLFGNGLEKNPIQLYKDGRLVVGAMAREGGGFRICGAVDGKIVWSTPKDVSIGNFCWPGIDENLYWEHDGKVLCCQQSDDQSKKTIFCLERESGKTLWKFDASGLTLSIIDKNSISFLDEKGNTKKIEIADGKVAEMVAKETENFSKSYKFKWEAQPTMVFEVIPGIYLVKLNSGKQGFESSQIGYACIDAQGNMIGYCDVDIALKTIVNKVFISKDSLVFRLCDRNLDNKNVSFKKLDIASRKIDKIDETQLPEYAHLFVSDKHYIPEDSLFSWFKTYDDSDKKEIIKIDGKVYPVDMWVDEEAIAPRKPRYDLENIYVVAENLSPDITKYINDIVFWDDDVTKKTLSTFDKKTNKLLWKIDGDFRIVDFWRDYVILNDGDTKVFDGRTGKLMLTEKATTYLGRVNSNCIAGREAQNKLSFELILKNLDLMK